MDDDLKAKAIDNIYAYGRAVAMLEVEPNAAVDGWIKRAMESSDPAKYIQVYSITKNLEPLPGNDSVTKYQELGAIVDNCTESEADEFLPGYFSDMQNRKYEMAREHQYSPKRIIELYTAYNLFGTGEDKRGRAIQWLMDEKGWPQNNADELYDLWKISDSEKLDNWRW